MNGYGQKGEGEKKVNEIKTFPVPFALGKFAPVLIGLLSGLAEVERSLIQERTRESVEYRRATGGNLGGRPKTSDKKEKLVLRLREEGDSLRTIRDQTGLAVATIRKIIDRNKVAA